MNSPHDRNGDASPLEQAQAKVAQACTAISAGFLGLAEVTQTFYTTLVAREHLLMLGIHGIAKSALGDALFATLPPGKQWGMQLMSDTPPSALTGGLDIVRLRRDNEQWSNPVGSIREASYVKLTEVFKGPGPTLQSLLTILNERRFEENGEVEDLPLEIALGDSNELPGGRTDRVEPELRAMYDRFAVRFWLGRLSMPLRARLRRMYATGQAGAGANVQLTREELDALRDRAKTMPWSEAALRATDAIDAEVFGGNVSDISERAWGKAMKLTAAAAAVAGADEVLPEHLSICVHVLWDVPDERAPVRTAVLRQACPDYETATNLLDACHAAAEPVLMFLPSVANGSAGIDEVHQVIDAQKRVATAGAGMKSLAGSAVEPMRAEAREVWAELGDALAAYKAKAAAKIVAKEAF